MIRHYQPEIVYRRIILTYYGENDFENEKFTSFDGEKRHSVFH